MLSSTPGIYALSIQRATPVARHPHAAPRTVPVYHPVYTATRGTPVAPVRFLLICMALLLTIAPSPVAGQAAHRVTAAEENVRAEPNGERVAVVNRDFRLTVAESRGQWRAFTLDGWVPARSVIINRRDGFNLVVADGGTPIHSTSGGPAVGRIVGGAQLREITRQGGWVRVQRPAWLWGPSLAVAPATQSAPTTRAATAGDPAGRPAPAVAAAAVGTGPSTTPARPASRPLMASPSGDTIGSLAPATRMEVLGREGEWARVRVEGWVRAGADSGVDQANPVRDVSLRALRTEPERFRGTILQWQVQFVALQRADSVRTDFERGEPYILARDPGGEPGFVYIAVPSAHLPAVRRLSPLERIEVVARVRNGRSPLTGHPVLELVELRR